MGEKRLSGRPRRVVFVAGPRDAVPVLEALMRSPARVMGVVTLGGEGADADPEVRRLASGRDLPLRPAPDPGAGPALQWMHDLQPDLLVCAGWTEPLPVPLLALAPRGAAVIHPSLHPKQRPHSAVSWAILRGEPVTGCSLLLLEPRPTHGDLVDQRQVAITLDDTCATLGEKLAHAGGELLVAHLSQIMAGTAPRRPQAPFRRSSVLPERTPDMGITSFDRTTAEVHDWIRAQTRPLPGAFAFLRGRRLVLWRADRLAGHRTHAPPGTVLGVDEGGVVVTTRSGAVKLLEVGGAAGSPSEPAVRWFAREQLPPGCVFDPVDEQTLAWALGRRPRGGGRVTRDAPPSPADAARGPENRPDG
ncbi:MAG: methionyl-tRNA formyltransferase [Nocardioides sp.]